MAIGAFEPDRAITDHRIEFGGGGKPAQLPRLLIPPAAQDPRPVGMRCSVSSDLGQRLGQGARVRQVERERGKAQLHDMEMRIDHPRHHDVALAIDLIIGARRALVAAMEDLDNASVAADDHPGKVIDLSSRIQRQPVDVIDQRVGGRGGGNDTRGRCGEEVAPRAHLACLCGRRRISALVSCRPAPIA